jgi:hypothetical protein
MDRGFKARNERLAVKVLAWLKQSLINNLINISADLNTFGLPQP